MKINYIQHMLLSLCCLSLVRCSNDRDIKLPEQPASGEYGYFSLHISWDETDLFTRASNENSGNFDEDYGRRFEYKIENMRLVLYETLSGIATHVFDLDVRSNPTTWKLEGKDVHSTVTPQERRFATVPRLVKMNNYYPLVTVNTPPEILALTEEGCHMEAFHSYIHSIRNNDLSLLIGNGDNQFREHLTDTTRYSFFMSNFKKNKYMEGVRVLYDTPAGALGAASPPYIMLDRAVARVQVDVSEATNETSLYDLGEITWQTDILNKQTWLVRYPAKMSMGFQHPNTGNNGIMETLGEMNRIHLYATDPNYKNISKLRNPSSTADLNEEFHYIRSVTDTRYDWEYVPENTMEEQEQYEDVTTRVVLKFRLIPKTGGFTKGESYYLYRDPVDGEHFISIEEMKAYAAGEKPLPTNMAPALDYLKALENWSFDHPEAIQYRYGEHENTLLAYYENGFHYHAVPIRHFRDELAPDYNDHGRYGVVRNNTYRLKLTRITREGQPTIPPPKGNNDGEIETRTAAVSENKNKIQIIEW